MANTINTELQLQSACVMWFHNTFPAHRGMLHCNMNNSFNRIAGATAKSLGVVSGVSDLELICHDGKIWFIELKFGNGVQSYIQTEWQYQIEMRGHKYILIHTLTEFKNFIYATLGNS